MIDNILFFLLQLSCLFRLNILMVPIIIVNIPPLTPKEEIKTISEVNSTKLEPMSTRIVRENRTRYRSSENAALFLDIYSEAFFFDIFLLINYV